MFGRTDLRLTIVAVCITLGVLGGTAAEPANAQCTPPSMATGNIDDLINYAACVNGCGLQVATPAGDVCKTLAFIIPCAPQAPCAGGGGTYYVNGFDLTHAALAYESASHNLYLGYRVAGLIGDTDGNGDPNTGGGVGCQPGTNVSDQAGIGSLEHYFWYIDTNFDNMPDIKVIVNGALPNPTVSIVNASDNPIAGAAGTAIVTGHDIKVKVTGISDPNTGFPGLPAALRFFGLVDSTPDGLSEDAFGPLDCTGPSDVSEGSRVALQDRVAPNPFSGTTSFHYAVIGVGQTVRIGVHDMAGRLVRTLTSGWQPKGHYTVQWDSRDDRGVQMAPGVYFLRARFDGGASVIRVVLLAR